MGFWWDLDMLNKNCLASRKNLTLTTCVQDSLKMPRQLREKEGEFVSSGRSQGWTQTCPSPCWSKSNSSYLPLVFVCWTDWLTFWIFFSQVFSLSVKHWDLAHDYRSSLCWNIRKARQPKMKRAPLPFRCLPKRSPAARNPEAFQNTTHNHRTTMIGEGQG